MKSIWTAAAAALLASTAGSQAATIVQTATESAVGVGGAVLSSGTKTVSVNSFGFDSLFDRGIPLEDVNAVVIEGSVSTSFSAAAFGGISLTDTEASFVARLTSGSSSSPVSTVLGEEARSGTFDGVTPIACDDASGCTLGKVAEETFAFSETFTGDDITKFLFGDPFSIVSGLNIAVGASFSTGKSDPGKALSGQAALTADLTLTYFTGDDTPGGGGGPVDDPIVPPDNTTVVPLPAAGWLLVAGLGALGLARRKG